VVSLLHTYSYILKPLQGAIMKHYNTIIIGAGPSGLCCSYHLKEAGIEHLILEKDTLLHTWKNERWDSFNLVTPNWMTRLPGMEDSTPSNNEFMTKQEIVDVLEAFAKGINPTILEHTSVREINQEDTTFKLETNHGSFSADHVIVSIGLFNTPKIPECSKHVPDSILQLHSVDYKNPSQLKEGNALVIGAGRSGVQIAYEIKKDTPRDVWLALGTLRPIPPIYAFTNGVYWLNRLSGFTHFNDSIPYKTSDTNNQNIMSKMVQNLGGCVKLGITLTGRFNGYSDNGFYFEPNLHDALEAGKTYMTQFEKEISNHIQDHDLSVSHEQSPLDLPELQKHNLEETAFLSKDTCNIKNIIWCTGFKPDYSWIHLNVFDSNGYPIHSHGKTDINGLYFTGLSLDPGFGGTSGFGIGLFAIAEDAKRVVSDIIQISK